MTRTLTLACLMGLALGGCKKYDENESFLHLRTPEARLAGSWTSQEVTASDSTVVWTDFFSPDNLQMTATFDKGGSVVFQQESKEFEGLWDFNGDKSVLHIRSLTSPQDSDAVVLDLYWEILGLEGDRLEAAHFREYNGETISDQAFFLRFEKQD